MPQTNNAAPHTEDGELEGLLIRYDEAIILNYEDDASYLHLPEYLKAKAAIQAYTARKVKEAEDATAEWFSDGVPHGFTKESWLVVMRTEFSEDGKPVTRKDEEQPHE